jgi:hypothetical protein
VVEHLPSKCKVLRSNSSTTIKNKTKKPQRTTENLDLGVLFLGLLSQLFLPSFLLQTCFIGVLGPRMTQGMFAG